MKCPTVPELSEYVEGNGSPQRRARLATHVDGCSNCHQEVLALQRTTLLLHNMPQPIIPTDMWPDVAARIVLLPRFELVTWLWRGALGVGVLASVAMSVFLLNRPRSPLLDAPYAATPYVLQHQLLSARDPLADRANVGVLLSSRQSDR